jgi:uncharacterized protein with GYD domain
MSLYFLLGTLTENGQRMLLRNPDMMIEAIRKCDCEGAQVLGQYAVLGKYDYVMIAEADDNEAVARLALEIGVRAGLHTETLPAMAIGVRADEEPDNGGQGEARFADLPTASGEEWRVPRRDP